MLAQVQEEYILQEIKNNRATVESMCELYNVKPEYLHSLIKSGGIHKRMNQPRNQEVKPGDKPNIDPPSRPGSPNKTPDLKGTGNRTSDLVGVDLPPPMPNMQLMPFTLEQQKWIDTIITQAINEHANLMHVAPRLNEEVGIEDSEVIIIGSKTKKPSGEK